MVKMIRGIVLLALCVIVSCCGDTVKGEAEGNGISYCALEDRMLPGKDRGFYFYTEKGRTKEISYVSYSVEIREDVDAGGDGREVTVIRIVRK